MNGQDGFIALGNGNANSPNVTPNADAAIAAIVGSMDLGGVVPICIYRHDGRKFMT